LRNGGAGFRAEVEMNTELEKDIHAYEAQRGELEARFGDQWVIFKGGEFKGAFHTYDSAVTFGLSKFGDTDFLLRQIEDRPVNIPMLFTRE
jgi:hypothetical protein